MDRQTRVRFVTMCLVCLVLGFAAGTTGAIPNPVNPHPQPRRPVVEFLKRVGRLGLWVALIAEPSPASSPDRYAHHVPDHVEPADLEAGLYPTRISHYGGW
jgi:hypothetical protein